MIMTSKMQCPREVGREHEFIRRSLNAKVPTGGGRDRESED